MKEKWKFMNVTSTYFEYTPHFTRLAGLTNFMAEKLLSKRSVIFGRSFIGVDTDRFEKLWNILISTVLGPYVHVPDILSQISWYKSLYCCDRCCLRHKTSIDNCQPRTQSYWSFHTLKTWSGRVFRDPGFDQNTVRDSGKTQNILAGNGIWLLPGKRDSPKFRARGVGFFSLSVRNGKSWRLNTRSRRQMRFNKASVQLCLLSTEQNICSDVGIV